MDEVSLIRSGPVRMKFACRVPAKLCGSVQVWFNGEGYSIKLEPEVDLPRTAAPALPPPPPPPAGRGPGDQDKDKRKDADQDHDASMEEDDSIDTAAWEKLGISAAGPTAPKEGIAGLRAVLGSSHEGMSLSIPNQYGSNMGSVSSPPLGAALVAVVGVGGGGSPAGLSLARAPKGPKETCRRCRGRNSCRRRRTWRSQVIPRLVLRFLSPFRMSTCMRC